MTITVTQIYFDQPVEIDKEEGALKKDFSYERFIRPNEEQMTRIVWRIVRNPEDAEDTIQDALSTIWKKRRLVCTHPNPRALILKICIDAAYDTLRKQCRRRKHEEPTTLHLFSPPGDKPVIAHSPAASQTNHLDRLVQKETEREILAAIGRLPRKQAVAVLLRIVKKQPYELIAQAMGCSESTVRIHVARGRARLNQWLAHLNPLPPGEELEKSIYFWEAAARNFFQVGVLMTVIGFIIMLKNIPQGITNVWKALGICFVTSLYGLVLAALSTIAGLRVVKKVADPWQPQQEMKVLPTIQGNKWNIEKIVGALLFIATLGWVVMKAGALEIFIHWPSLLMVSGGAILFVLLAGNGEDGLSTTLSFAFAGVTGILFGLVQMFHGCGVAAIAGIAEGMSFAILSGVFGLVGMLLGGVHRQDHGFETGKTGKKITISRIAWYGFPVVVLMLILYVFVLILIPIVKKA